MPLNATQPRRRVTCRLLPLLGALAILGRPATPAFAQTERSLAGAVLTAADSTPLVGARVRLLEPGQMTSTDLHGRFRFARVPRRVLTLVVERIGIVPDTLTIGPDVTTVTLYVRTRAVMLPPVTSVGQPSARERFEHAAQTSTTTLDASEIAAVPGVAEADVARTVQLLPGTVARHDFTTGLNVRGGETDQNLIRLDGIPVFNPTHLGGLYSTFEPAAVRAVEFITGGFPAGYGGRLSSVLDVTLRDGANDHRLSGGLSLLSARALAEGPLVGGATYLLGGRRTYADKLADNFSDDPFTYYFADGIGKLTVPLGRGGSIAATGYWGRDQLDIPWLEPTEDAAGIDLALHWGNRLAGLTLRLPVGPAVFEQNASVSAFATRQAFEPDVQSFTNTARVWSLQTAVGMSLGPRHLLRLGGGWERYRMVYHIRNDAIEQDVSLLQYEPEVWSGFVDEQWRPADALLIRPGVRVEYVKGAGVTTVAPRLAVKAFLNRDFALTGSAGRYYQAIQSISDPELPINIYEIWIGANAVVPVARSDHLVGGFERWFGPGTSLTIEGYYKTFSGLAIRNLFDDPKLVGDEFEIGDGDAKGFDVLLRRHTGAVRGWIAYSFTRTIRRTASDTFPPGHDRRHTLDVVAEAPGPLGSRLGLHWGYGSPLPYTAIEGAWLHRDYNPVTNSYDDFEDEPIGTRLNRARYPHYSRLDLSLRWELAALGGTLRPFVQVVNLYNRTNVFVYRFDYRSVPPTRSGLSQLPFLPTLGVEFEW